MRKIKIPLIVAFASGIQLIIGQTKDSIGDQTRVIEGVVITASKIRESILKSSASIQVLSEKDIKNTPSNSFYDALENVQGVQMITPSMGFKVINARGFTNTTNVRFAQLVNGMDIASPHIGSPIGNSLGPNDLDIQRVEVLPGMAAALYGMNTMNGLANLITKNPFTSQGFSFRQNTALTHLSNDNSKAQLFTETSFRYAKAISPKFAFKINGSILHGSDWIASDYSDLNPTANKSVNLLGADNPAYDAVNSYGNESSNRKTITLGGKKYVVGRTGYLEKDLADNTLKNIKADLGLYYKFNEKSMISYTYRFSTLDNIYQRANRFKLQDYFTQQHGLQFENSSITAKVYLNNESTGKSYNLRSMGENIDRNFKSDTKWYSDFTTGYNTAVGSGAAVADALKQARLFADMGRYQPGTDAYNAVLKQLQDVNNWDFGAALRVKQSFLHSEVQVNLTEQYLSKLKNYGINILVGADNRTYFIMPDGNYFINPESSDAFENYTYSKTGGFVSVTKKLFQEKLSLQAILRVDKSDYFEAKLNPRFSAVYTPVSGQSFRTSFQQGYRFPSIFEAFSNVNSGGVKRVGGLPVMSNGIFENAYLDTSIKAFQAQVLTDINGGMAQTAAIEKNKGLLKKNPYTYLNPEKVKSIEFGYKGFFLDKSLFLDADVYFSHYEGFIAQTNMNVPLTTSEAEIPAALYDNAKQIKYRMYTNSKTAVNAYGYSLGATYVFAKGYTAKANATFSKLNNIENQDGLEDGFNTPDWMVNVSLTKENILKNTDVGLVYRWQNSYYWQSFLANGQVSAYTNIDAQITHKFPKINTSVKIGATNLLNHYYTSFIGAPSVGGMYYTLSFTIYSKLLIMKNFISVFEAKNIVQEKAFTLPVSQMKLLDAVGLTLAEDVVAICDIPAYNQSSVDGYAFQFKDNEQVFTVVGEMAAGTNIQLELNIGEAARIFTGAPLPNGADTIIMQEHTELKEGKLFLKDENISKGNNVRPQGAEVQKDTLAMKKGTSLTVAAIGFLAGIGITDISIFSPPKVAIILTGNELQKPGLALDFGQVYEANSFILISALKQLGIKDIEVLTAEDNLSILQNTLETALEKSDIVLLTGGVSVGDYDFVVQAVEKCNIETHFHKIKQRPGKPLLFGTKENKAVFGLPGNPSSGLVCFYEYVLPFIEIVMHKNSSIKKISAVLTHDYKKIKGLTHFLKGHFEDGKVTPLQAQESFRLHSFSQANCLIVLEEERTDYVINETVEVHLLPF